MSKLLETWHNKFAATRDNEDGAETIEIIIFLAIFVLGMVGVWFAIRAAAGSKGDEIENCLNNSGINDGMNGKVEC